MNKYSLYGQRKFNLEVSAACSWYRKEILKLTLKELSEKSGIPISTLSTFEMGRSSNLRFIYVYLVSCETQKQRDTFIDCIDLVLVRGNQYDE